MEQYGKVKETDEAGMFSINLKKKAEKKDGTPAQKIKVVGTKKDADGIPIAIDPKTLGNGSKSNVKIMMKSYQIKGPKGNVTKEGTQIMLTAVQVTDLVVYEPKNSGTDFDFDEGDDEEQEAAPKKAAGKPGRPAKAAAQDDDDDIPF